MEGMWTTGSWWAGGMWTTGGWEERGLLVAGGQEEPRLLQPEILKRVNGLVDKTLRKTLHV